MAQQTDYIEYLSREIGPRPAGTEEEQQAALYIAEEFRSEAGFPAVIEDITSASNIESPRAICAIVTVVVALIALFYHPFMLAAVVISLISGLIYAAEALGKPVITGILAKGASQNVVAKYEPSTETTPRARKIVLLAHYDSGKVKPKFVQLLESAPFSWEIVCLVAMVFLPIFMLLRFLFFIDPQGAVGVIVNIITVAAVVLAALPAVKAVLYRMAPFSEGANDNASGVATMLSIAKNISEGLMNEEEISALENDTVVHDEEAAHGAGLVPDGAEVVYHAKPSTTVPADDDDLTPAQRLSAAKAAIAALTGEEVSSENFITEFPDEEPAAPGEVKIKEIPASGAEASQAAPSVNVENAATPNAYAGAGTVAAEAPVETAAEAAAVFMQAEDARVAAEEKAAHTTENGVPDWFAEAQKKAKHSTEKVKPAQRSRYADALDAAVSASSAFFDEANRIVQTESEERLRARSADIVEVKPPLPGQRPNAAGAQQPMQTRAPAQAQAPAQPQPAPSVDGKPAAQTVASPADRLAATLPQVETPAPALAQRIPSMMDEAQAEDRSAASSSRQSMEEMGYETVANTFAEKNIPMPSFLDPRVAQEKAMDEQAGVDRTANRVDVTSVPVASDGRAETAEAPSVNGTTRMAPIKLSPEELQAMGANRDAVVAMSQRIGEVSERPRTQGEAAGETPQINVPPVQTGVQMSDATPDFAVTQQRAPLADASGKDTAKGLLSTLPSINLDNPTEPSGPAPSKSGMMRALRTKLPSMSGSLERVEEDTAPAVSNVSTVGSFGAAGATGTFNPVGDELLEDVDPDDMYVDDADDSDVEENYTETGAYAGPGYVDMPKSRARRFLDKFHFGKNKNKDEEESPQEWLDVEDEFDPRAVGKERGSWESFRGEKIESRRGANDDGTYDDAYQDDAYSDDRPYADDAYVDDAGYADDFYDEEPEEAPKPRSRRNRKWQGGALSRVRLGRVDMNSSEEIADAEAASAHDEDIETPDEIKQIYQFRNTNFNTEVWFVALGSEIDHHDGVRAFINEHQSELRGAIIVDIEALGAGQLTVVQDEGSIKKAKTSSRMKRYTSKASRESGVSVSELRGKHEDTAASICISSGLQAMHLIGAENGSKALTAGDEDVLENIDETKLEENTYFVEELIKAV